MKTFNIYEIFKTFIYKCIYIRNAFLLVLVLLPTPNGCSRPLENMSKSERPSVKRCLIFR